MDDRKKSWEELLVEVEALRSRLTEMDEAERKGASAETVSRKGGASEHSQDKFLAYVVHELKTPLNSLFGFMQLLRKGTFGPLTDAQSRIMERMSINLIEMVHLTNNILDLSKLDSGKSGAQMAEIRPRELAERVAMVFEPFLLEKGLRFELAIDPAFPASFRSDPIKLKSILTNLLSNAIKFTPRGEVRLSLRPLSSGEGIQICVSDTGVGIASQHLERIFEEYEQEVVAEQAPQYVGGTGLGLAIVKKMVGALGGAITVESRPGVGTVFTVTLPEPSV